MNEHTIDLAREFSKYPFGRYLQDGDDSAERFRDGFLIPALERYDHVTVDLGGTNFYGSSFLEETFGGLLRSGFKKDDLDKQLTVLHDKLPSIVEEVNAYIEAQNKRTMQQAA